MIIYNIHLKGLFQLNIMYISVMKKLLLIIYKWKMVLIGELIHRNYCMIMKEIYFNH